MIVSLIGSARAFGQAIGSANVQVGHDSWTFKDGAPENVYALAQTDDGFLWLGSETGLVRFDGLRFEPFRSPFGDQLLSTAVYALFAPPSGGLWIGYRFGGFSFVEHGRVTNYGTQLGSPTRAVWGFVQDRDGIIWAATATGLWRFNRGLWEHLGAERNAPKETLCIGFDSEGILWALSGTTFGPKDLVFLMPGTAEFRVASRNLLVEGFGLSPEGKVVTEPTPNSLKANQSVGLPSAYPALRKNSFQIVDRNNGVWVLQGHTLARVAAGERLADAIEKASPSNSETYEIDPYFGARLLDREGNIWFGTATGLHRFFYSPLTKQELPLGTFALAPGDDGAIWIATVSRPYFYLYRVFDGKAETFLKLKSESLSFVYRAPDKALWFGGDGGIWRLAGRNLVRIVLPPELAKQTSVLQAITQDHHGGMWVSLGSRGLYRLADGIWTPYGGRTDLPKTRVSTEFTDSQGRVWFGYHSNQLAVLDGAQVRVFGPDDGVNVGNITAIYGRRAEIWIGGEFGLQQVDSGRLRGVSALNRELLRGISGIIETADGDLWLNGLSGIVHLPRSELSEALRDPSYQLKGHRIGTRAGLLGFPAQLRPLQTAVEGSDAKLWFAGTHGVAWLDPGHVRQEAPLPPPTTIESLSADGKSYELVAPPTLPARIGSVQIDYAAVSLSDPEGTHFRYKLQEIDKGWNEATAATPVTYRNLPPGSYHFSVEASDANGAWSGTSHNMAFTILPAFYQTVWFRFLGVILFLVVLTGIYQLRLRQLARQYGMRERLLQLEAELAHINRVSTLGEMAASLAHEIKQPIAAAITSANSCIEWLAHEPPNLDRARVAAARIDKYANRAAEIIDRIRSLYKKSPPQRELVDVNGIIEEMLTLLKGEATRYPIAMRTELTTELPEIMADPVQLQQVFMNLVLNAIEAMKDSGGELTVTSQLQDGQLQFSISDTGVGLPTEKMDQIFSAFFTTKPLGSGMGLAISRSIVESHGGRLWATANDGRGATLRFTLPTQTTETSPLVA